jgi:hypothetical protein
MTRLERRTQRVFDGTEIATEIREQREREVERKQSKERMQVDEKLRQERELKKDRILKTKRKEQTRRYLKIGFIVLKAYWKR